MAFHKQQTDAQENGQKVLQPCSRLTFLLTWCLAVLLMSSICVLVSTTFRWPIVLDPPLYNYIGWLMTQGAVPYRDVFDTNLPGTYVIHFGVVKYLGDGDLAWRWFDLLCLALINIATYLYCSRFGRLSALTAVALFSAFHLYNGPLCAGQRDYILIVFIMGGIYFYQKYRESKRNQFYFMLTGLLLGAGITIKPFVVFWCALFLLLTIASDYRKHAYCFRHYALYVICCSASTIAVAGWLWRANGLQPFIDIFYNYLIPLYPKLQPSNLSDVLRGNLCGMPIGLLLGIVLVFGICDVLISRKNVLNRVILVCGIIYGLLHYALQRKGFAYHLYPAFLFVFLLAASWLEYIKQKRFSVLHMAMLCLTFYLMVGLLYYSVKNIFIKPPNYFDVYPFPSLLVSDLKGRVPQNETVQSMEALGDGILCLLQLHIRQPTRFIHDVYFYYDINNPYVQGLRNEFLQALQAAPPLFIIFVKYGWPIYGYERIKRFPELNEWLHAHYTLDREREAYRLYKRREG